MGAFLPEKHLMGTVKSRVSNPDLPSEASEHQRECGEATAEETFLKVYAR